MLQQIGRGEHSEQCLPTLILVLGKKETLLGISLQRVTGQTESEFFRGSRVVPMGEREEKARCIVAVPTGPDKQNFSFFLAEMKSEIAERRPVR